MERLIWCGSTQIQAVAVAALFTNAAYAQTAGMMSFQGLIRDNGGVAAQGAVTLQLQIVDAGDVVIDASGNGSVGPEDTYVVNTTAEQGIVSVKYGPIAPSAFNGSERRLKVTVTSPGGYPTLTPVEIVTPPAIAEQLNARGTGNPAVIASPSGLVGIGSSSPNERLTVGGSVALDGFNFFYARATPGSNSNATSLGFSGQIGGVLTLSNNGNNEIRAGRGATGGQLRFFVNNTADPFTASNGNEAMTIAASGRVGIGTNNPNSQLNVSFSSPSDSNKAAEFTLHGAGGSTVDFVRNSTANGQTVRRFQIRGGNDFDARPSFGLGMQTNHELYFFTNDVERIRVTAGGNVGIGSTTPHPSFQLHTSGGFNDWRGGIAATGTVNALVAGELNGYATIGGHNAALTAWTNLAINPGGGNVGIGTFAPAEVLHVESPTDGALRLISGTGIAGVRMFSGGTGLAAVYSPAGSDDLRLFTGGADRVSVLPSGRVGVGTSSPAEQLHVEGQAYSSLGYRTILGNTFGRLAGQYTNSGGFASDLVLSANYDPITTARDQAAYGTAMIRLSSQQASGVQSRIEFLTGLVNTIPSTRMTVTSDGSVGIGTSTPSTRLHVVGNVTANCGVLSCSDRRFKTNFRDVENAIDLVQKLRPVHFDWRTTEFPDREFPATPQIGFVAQEVEPLVPEVVLKGADGFYSVDYGRLTPLLTAAIQELSGGLSARTAELQIQLAERDRQIAQQQREITLMKERLDKIERLLANDATASSMEETK